MVCKTSACKPPMQGKKWEPGVSSKNMWKPLYFEKAAHYLVPWCWTVRHRNSTAGPAVFYGFTHTFIHGTWQILPPRTASDVPIFFFERQCFGTNAENKHCYPHQKLFPECLWWKLAQSLWINHKFQLFATGLWSLYKDNHKLYWSV